MKNNLIFICLPFLVMGCATVTSPSYSPHKGNERGIPVHGNFCGKNIPTVKITTPSETINELLKIPAIDRIDEACKKHDICYVSKNKTQCDNVFVNAVSRSNFKSGCDTLVLLMKQPFNVKNFNKKSYAGSVNHKKSRVEKNIMSPITDPMLHTLFNTYLTVGEVAFTAAAAGITTLYSPLLSTISKDGEKFLSPIPSRYFNCDE